MEIKIHIDNPSENNSLDKKFSQLESILREFSGNLKGMPSAYDIKRTLDSQESFINKLLDALSKNKDSNKQEDALKSIDKRLEKLSLSSGASMDIFQAVIKRLEGIKDIKESVDGQTASTNKLLAAIAKNRDKDCCSDELEKINRRLERLSLSAPQTIIERVIESGPKIIPYVS